MSTEMYLGIDIAKDTFQVTLLGNERTYRHAWTNDPKGFGELQRWLRQHQVQDLHACLEATGRYGEALAEFLHQQSRSRA